MFPWRYRIVLGLTDAQLPLIMKRKVIKYLHSIGKSESDLET